AVGDLVIGWRLLVQAGVARAALAAGADKKDEAFYQGKIATCAFFAKNMLPKLTSLRAILESIDDDIMRLSEDSFGRTPAQARHNSFGYTLSLGPPRLEKRGYLPTPNGLGSAGS